MISLGSIGTILLGICIIWGLVRSQEMGCLGIFMIIGLILILLFVAAVGLLTWMAGGSL